ncbi:MAG: response regulator transcription factor [Tannerella sp.]|jgi:DNA-binding NarL/FixJ family response regulator|nr:response regulator transcription factor [Tannerella sp.]
MITVNILDDHRASVESWAEKLNNSDAVRVTGEYYNIDSARKGLTESNLPDVFLLDVELPDGNGLDFCKELTGRFPGLKIIVQTHYREPDLCRIALKYKARGFLLKEDGSEERMAAIISVNAGKTYISAKIKKIIDDDPLRRSPIPTRRERIFLHHLGEGLTYEEIAAEMESNKVNINEIRKRLFIKFKVKNAPQLISKAFKMGYLPVPENFLDDKKG